MQITAATLQLTSSHQAQERQERRESLTHWRDGEAPTQVDPGTARGGLRQMVVRLQAEAKAERLEISRQAASLQPQRVLLAGPDREAESEDLGDLKIQLLKSLVERFTGREIKLMSARDFQVESGAPVGTAPADGTADAPPQPQGWGLIYDYYEAHIEEEQTRFSATGRVRTADGQELSIELELNLSRRFVSEKELHIRDGDALKDPLVVNFAGTAAELTQRRFSFDLDSDGRAEQMAFLAPGSGFLALDRNGDGAISDGGELFGASSGDGFSELAALDADGNGWVDGGDPLYAGLRIWTKDADGQDYLAGLGERGIGALYLGRVATPFRLTDEANETLGQVRTTGLFLREDGSAGSLQQIDLKV